MLYCGDMSAPGSAAMPLGARNDVPLRRFVVAAALSACIPGTGQFLLGRKREGSCLLILFALLVGSLTILRLPTSLLGFAFVILAWALLSLCACSTVFYGGSHPPRSMAWWILIFLLVVIALNVVFVPCFRLAGFLAFKVNSTAMEPTYFPADRIAVDARAFRADTPQRDDIVAINRGDFVTFKRVIAVGGDTVVSKDRVLTLNGAILNEPFIQHSQPGRWANQDTFGPVPVPAGKFFVMGDNRDVSLDSRDSGFGLVNANAIVGKALYVYLASGRRSSRLRWSNPLAIFNRDK